MPGYCGRVGIVINHDTISISRNNLGISTPVCRYNWKARSHCLIMDSGQRFVPLRCAYKNISHIKIRRNICGRYKSCEYYWACKASREGLERFCIIIRSILAIPFTTYNNQSCFRVGAHNSLHCFQENVYTFFHTKPADKKHDFISLQAVFLLHVVLVHYTIMRPDRFVLICVHSRIDNVKLVVCIREACSDRICNVFAHRIYKLNLADAFQGIGICNFFGTEHLIVKAQAKSLIRELIHQLQNITRSIEHMYQVE